MLDLAGIVDDKANISPRFTAIDAGLKRMVSFISTVTVRVAFFGSPALPKRCALLICAMLVATMCCWVAIRYRSNAESAQTGQ
jgi:hypothetical protein